MSSFASLSLDLDDQWSYMKVHGDKGWKNFPSYFDIFIPDVLDVLDRLNLKITFFIVGQDAALDRNKELLRLLTERGHEVGNHSFHHEPWFHLYSKDQIKREVLEAEESITWVTKHKPIGFRGPGFSWSFDLLEVLAESKYVYDTSILPTYISPLARAFYFSTTDFTKAEKKQRSGLFGRFEDGLLRPVKAYRWELASDVRLLEIPVTTTPILKLPFHLSYLLYLSRFSVRLTSFYLKIALTLCRITQTEPSFLLHPLDLLGSDQIPELAFFPGMDLSRTQKVILFEMVLKELKKHFTLVTMNSHAQSLLKQNHFKVLSPSSTN